MKVLALDTSTRAQSVAVASDGKLVADIRCEIASSHSDTLTASVALALSAAALRPSDLHAVAVAAGPGSFTGLRIGIATAKGLALAAGIPVAGFSTLRALAEALAVGAGSEHAVQVCALLDAGRGQVYRGVYRTAPGGSGPWRTLEGGDEDARDPGDAAEGLDAGVVVGGEGFVRHAAAILPDLPTGALMVHEIPYVAGILALRAEAILQQGRLAEHPVVPNYIRLPDALGGSRA